MMGQKKTKTKKPAHHWHGRNRDVIYSVNRQFKHQTLAVKRYVILGLPCSYVISFCVPWFGFLPLVLHLNAKLQ